MYNSVKIKAALECVLNSSQTLDFRLTRRWIYHRI